MKRCFFALLSLFMVASEAAWSVRPNGSGSIILDNFNGNAEKNKTRKWLPLVYSGAQIRKRFDLTALPADWRSDIGGAELHIYCQIADQSEAVRKIPRNGLTEKFAVTINGHRLVIDAADPRVPKWRNYFRLTFPAEWITGNTLDVRINKLHSKTNDDYLYVGIDTSSQDKLNDVSVNEGKSFVPSHGAFGGHKGSQMIRLVLFRNKTELSADAGKNPSAFKLHKGAKIENKTIKYNGTSAYAELKNSAGFNVTEKGLTIAAVLRMDPNPANSPKKDHNMMVAYKDNAWFIGRTGNQFNFSFSTGDKRWNNAMFGGEYPELGEWMHLTAVFERVNEQAQGQIGYMLKIYLNGELATQKLFLYAEPRHSEYPILIGGSGVGYDGYYMQGEVASVEVFARGLNEGEVAELMKKSDRISKLPPGFFELAGSLTETFRQLKAVAKNPETRFVVNALERAASTGYDQNKMLAILKDAGNIFGSNISGKALADQWNRTVSDIKMLYSPKGTLLIVSGKGAANSPVIGLYNPRTGNDVFDNRSTSWTINFDGRQVHDRHHTVTFDVNNIKSTADGGSFTVVWTKAGDFECRSDFRFSNGRLEQDFEAKTLKNKTIISEIIFPRYFLKKLPGKDDRLVFPLFSGVERKNPTKSFGESGLYPTARSAMQFVGYYDASGNGVYAAFEATDGALKHQVVTGKGGVLDYKWQNPTATNTWNAGDVFWRTSGPAVVETYEGNWFEAGQIYKKFVESKAPWAVTELPRKDTPKWYRDNCLWVVISPATHHAAPYLRKYFDMPFASWFCRSTMVTADHDAKPFYKPLALTAAKKLPGIGVYLQAYFNGRLWAYAESAEPEYDIDRSKEERFIKGSVILRNGSTYMERYGYPYAIMCTDHHIWHDQMLEMARVSHEAGVNGVYWDQLPCGSARQCWNKHHNHAPGDPTAWARGYQNILRSLKAKYPHLANDGEDNSEIYVNTIDGFMTWRFTEPDHVPLFQSIYSGGRVQFVGRAWDTFGYGRGDYEATFAKLGEQFVWGEQIGWMHIYDERFGTPRRMYAKKLAHLRRAMLGYLNEADMLAPLKFKNPVPRMTAIWGNTRSAKETTDKILSCAWKRIRDGKVTVLFTNTTTEDITVEPVVDYGLDKLIIFKEGAEPEYIDLANGGSIPPVSLGKYQSEIWIFGNSFDRVEANNIAKTSKKVASFTHGGGSIPLSKPDFTKVRNINASNGNWIYAKDHSWMISAFLEGNQTLGHNPGAKNETGGNWFLARNGATVSFGEVDFGKKSPKYLEVRYAVSPENDGGKFELRDITGNGDPEFNIAEIPAQSTGGWFTLKTVRVPVKGNITGKRLIVFRFFGKEAAVRGWRVIY